MISMVSVKTKWINVIGRQIKEENGFLTIWSFLTWIHLVFNL